MALHCHLSILFASLGNLLLAADSGKQAVFQTRTLVFHFTSSVIPDESQKELAGPESVDVRSELADSLKAQQGQRIITVVSVLEYIFLRELRLLGLMASIAVTRLGVLCMHRFRCWALHTGRHLKQMCR